MAVPKEPRETCASNVFSLHRNINNDNLLMFYFMLFWPRGVVVFRKNISFAHVEPLSSFHFHYHRSQLPQTLSMCHYVKKSFLYPLFYTDNLSIFSERTQAVQQTLNSTRKKLISSCVTLTRIRIGRQAENVMDWV